MTKKFTIPQRRIAARLVREVAARAFMGRGIVPQVTQERCLGGWRIGTAGTTIETALGQAEWSVSCSDGLLHVYCQFVGPMTDARRELARRLGGNPYSGKLNWWWAPDKRIADAASFQMAAEDVAICYSTFADRIAKGG